MGSGDAHTLGKRLFVNDFSVVVNDLKKDLESDEFICKHATSFPLPRFLIFKIQQRKNARITWSGLGEHQESPGLIV